MQTIVAELPIIRRMEAISFRSFPATTTYFNGTWAVRLTAGLPAKRLNSINPLDPADHWNLPNRLTQEIKRFADFGRPVVVRLTPLAPLPLINHLDNLDWSSFGESTVMIVDLEDLNLKHAINLLPYQDVGRWINAVLDLEESDASLKPGKVEVISAIQAKSALFLIEDPDHQPLSALRTVKDGDLIGLFNIVSNPNNKRKGHAKSLLLSALQWAKHEGAKKAWLQVEVDNIPAISLYRSMGFSELYRYIYRQPKFEE